ncbi:MAG: NtaA/DmoA family FMN-dependent monooxygenase [Pseudomonadota bacterium]|nr:NtaA/DmoA family FMN-dependent monooxygenase [Pseudomonadota bacterium]
MVKQIHLSAFNHFSPAPHMPLSWIYPREKITHYWYEAEYWESVVRTLERGRFDMLFFADSLHGGASDDQIRYAIQFPTHDPVSLISYLSGIAKTLGFAVTMSTTFYPPFFLARTLATLDHLTKGRIGWNIVSSHSSGEARNFGMDELPAHDERYDRADEYMEACYALWNSWEDDAVVMDMEGKVFADPAKVHRVDFVGKWYKTQGPLTVIPSPRRRPFLFQAGQSERGKAFAARHAEGIFSAARGTKQMRAYCEDLATRREALGRDPAEIPIFWAGQPIVAATEAEARDRYAEIRARIPLEASLAQMSMHWGIECSDYDIDLPVTDLEVPGTRGLFEIYQESDPKITLRDIAKSYLSGSDKNPLIGTPDQVADAMQYLLEEGGGDGFQISPPYYAPDYYADLVDQLIPVLQKRGIYREDYNGSTLREHLA